MTSPSPIPFDRAAVQAHVEMLHRLAEGQDGILPLAVFGENPDTGRQTITLIQRFRVGDVDEMTSAALAYENHPHVNVYAPLAVMRRDLSRGQKGGEDDVVAVLGVVIDSDADAGRESRSPVEPNYVVQTSAVPAANRQDFILFDRTLPRVEAKPLAAALHSASGGDSGTKDLAHVWRIPGTANWPNRKKVLERNRPRDPQPVRVLKAWDGSLTSVDELRRVLAAQTGHGAKANGHAHEDTDSHDVAAIMARLGAGLRKLIAAPPIAGEDRSATLASVVTSMIRFGLSDGEIRAVIEAHPEGIGAKYIGRPDLANEIERLRRKFGTEWRQRQEQTGVTLDDFRAYMPMHSYIYTPARELWPASSVNARIHPVALVDANGQPVLNQKGVPTKLPAATWLDKNQPVEQMTWCPGQPMLIQDRLLSDGGWIELDKVTCFNLYRPPTIKPGNASEAGPWLDHIHKVYPDNGDHIVKWFAQRVQRPQEKINHAIVLGGDQGIGKDTMLEPVKRAVGPWNFQEVSPQQMLGRFNGFLKSVALRVSEARDLGDVNRFQFYDHMKTVLASPPDVLRIDEKNLREHAVFNCVGVIVTTNHKTDGIFLPSDDRRHYVAWSGCKRDDFADEYWNKLWHWYDHGGDGHVAAYLAELDLATFNPKAPPPKTPAFWEIVDASRAPEDAELADALDQMGSPDATTIVRIMARATGEFADWLKDRKNRRVIPHRLEKCGYVQVRNDDAQDGLWKINGKRQAVYAKNTLPLRDRIRAARALW